MTAPQQLQSLIEWTCVLEVRAPKPGNVHPHARFADLEWLDFVRSGNAVAPILARTAELGVGRAIREAVAATRGVAPSNTNLGIVLLLAPLAAAAARGGVVDQLEPVLAGLTVADAEQVYEAIRLAQPGGLGTTPEGDVAAAPTGTLREMMRLAAQRDSVAAEYAHGYPVTLGLGRPYLERHWPRGLSDPRPVIVGLHLELMAAVPDTLLARKCGEAIARESAERARHVLAAGWPNRAQPNPSQPNPSPSPGLSHNPFPEGTALGQFDAWLRAEGHRRNPGTTADLVAASLFIFLVLHPDRLDALPPEWLEVGTPGQDG
jgi:triphosphoribosyl-dephospho-CoA synthase